MNQVGTIQANTIRTASSSVIAITIRRAVAGAVGVAGLVIRVIEADTRHTSAINNAEASIASNTLVIGRAGAG